MGTFEELVVMPELLRLGKQLCKLPETCGELGAMAELLRLGYQLCKLPETCKELAAMPYLLLLENQLCKLLRRICCVLVLSCASCPRPVTSSLPCLSGGVLVFSCAG